MIILCMERRRRKVSISPDESVTNYRIFYICTLKELSKEGKKHRRKIQAVWRINA